MGSKKQGQEQEGGTHKQLGDEGREAEMLEDSEMESLIDAEDDEELKLQISQRQMQNFSGLHRRKLETIPRMAHLDATTPASPPLEKAAASPTATTSGVLRLKKQKVGTAGGGGGGG
ncbi:hypothetical protein Dimus_009052 [Dionaea muscipula]